MKAFVTARGLPVPLIEDNVDTDVIIPSREIRSVGKEGLADGLFQGAAIAGRASPSQASC